MHQIPFTLAQDPETINYLNRGKIRYFWDITKHQLIGAKNQLQM